MINKAIEKPWKKYDTEDRGYLSKEQTSDLAQDVLAAMGKKEIFDKQKFERAFDISMIAFDINSGAITQDDIKKIQEVAKDRLQQLA